jgi:multiple sugar transport system permease protein
VAEDHCRLESRREVVEHSGAGFACPVFDFEGTEIRMVSSIFRHRNRFAYLMTLPVVVVLFSLVIFPLVFSIFMSTQSSQAGLSKLEFVGLGNFIEVFSSSLFYNAALNTLIYVVGTVASTTVIGFIIAYLLNGITKGAGVFRTIFILSLAITPVVAGLTFGMMFNPLFGVVNYLLSLVGIKPLGWATEIKTALLTLMIVETWQWTPFMMIILYAGMVMLPEEIYEAGRMDGVRWWQEILYITLPSLKPVFLIALIFRFMDAFRSFDIIYSMTKGGPGNSTETLVIRAYLESLKYFRLEIGAVIGIVLLVITMVGTRITLRFLPK